MNEQVPPSVPGSRPPPTKSSGTKVALIVLAVVGVVAVLLAATCLAGIMLPALGKAREAAQRIKSQTQVRTIAQGLTVYAIDNDDQFPAAGEDWEQLLVSKGHVSVEMLTAPQAEPGQVSYYYVPGLELDFDTDQVLLYENPELYDNRGGSVAFVDGRTVWLEGQEFWDVIDNITLEDGTRYAPHRDGP